MKIEDLIRESKIKFEERYDNEELGVTTLFFTIPKECLCRDYPEAVGAELSLEFPIEHISAEYASADISPTKEIEGCLTDYDWHEINLSDEEIGMLIKLANLHQTDFYENTVIGIELEDGEKYVHFFGYGYCAEDGTETPYRFLEYTWFIAPLKDVLKVGFETYEAENSDQYKQYLTDCTEEEVYEMYRHYDNGDQPVVIKEEDITEDTPCGCYIII